MTSKPPLTQPPGGANTLGLPSIDQDGQFYKSAVRFTRAYAMFSPTMVGLLLAKKTRFGRFIPLPDALPDGFRLGSLNGNGTVNKTDGEAANGAVPHAENGKVAAPHGAPVVEKPGINGTSPKANATAGKTAHARLVEVEIAHQVPGRIRLTIPRLEHDAKFAQRLAVDVMALPDVHRARISPSSRSLVVEYHHQVMNAERKAAILPQVIECIRVAAGADGVRNAGPEQEQTPAAAPHVDLVARLALPAASLGLSAGMLAGVAVPPVLMGGLVLLAARPIFGRALEGWRSERRLTVEVLDSTTIVLMVSQASFLAPSIIVGVIESSQAGRDWTARRRRQVSLDRLLPPAQPVQVAGPSHLARRAWPEIEPGDELLLSAGDLISADGLVIEGWALVDQQWLTGDALPVARTAGDTVWAGSRLVEGHLRVVVQQTGHETAVGQAVALLQAAPETDTRISNYARKAGNWAVVPTLLVGGAVYAATGSLVRATGIVNLDLGTGMRVSSPLAYFVTRRRAATLGIQIRSGRALEMLAVADTVVIDQTALRNDARGMIDGLRGLGLEPRLFSGSSQVAVQVTAASLGIQQEHTFAGLSPQQKLEAVQALQAEGRKVAVIGDGIADVAAMTHADVAIALNSAGVLARESADIILLNDRLSDLMVAVGLARHTLHLLRQDMGLVTATNIGAIGYGALAVLPPAAPMLINNGSWVLASLNSMRVQKGLMKQRRASAGRLGTVPEGVGSGGDLPMVNLSIRDSN